MSDALARFVTDCARVNAYDGYIEIISIPVGARIAIFGQVARNLFGNQEYFLPLVEIDEITEIVGSTASTESERAEGKSYPDLVVEKVDDDLLRIGYSGDVKETAGVMIDVAALQAIIKACRIALLARNARNFDYDDDFWVVHAKVDNDQISISSRFFEIITENDFKLTIARENLSEWMEIFSAADDLEEYEAGSMIQLKPSILIKKLDDGRLGLELTSDDRVVKLVGSVKFFAICHRLMGIVWLGEDFLDDDFALIGDDEDDEDDDEEAGV